MSYCRFSSDQFKCDVYAFAHVDGHWQVYAANNRLVNPEPRPAPPAADWHLNGTCGINAFLAANNALEEWIEKATREVIPLEHAGNSFELRSPGECADTLEMLRGLGYHVPQYAIDALREEAAEPTA